MKTRGPSPRSSSAPLFVGLGALLMQACAPVLRGAPPSPPDAPRSIAPFAGRGVPRPEPKLQNLSEVTGPQVSLRASGPFPIQQGQTLVLAIPADAVGTPGGAGQDRDASKLSDGEKNMRAALLQAFLRSGFRVKDAGVLHRAHLKMHTYPTSKRSTTVRRRAASPDGAETIETRETKGSGHRAWWSDGMQLGLEDPTSLWAPELLAYPDLEAKAYLRVFSVQTHESSRTYGLRYGFAEADLELFKKRLAKANEARRSYHAAYAEAVARVRAYDAAYERYLSAHQAHLDRNRAYYASPRARRPSAAPKRSVTLPEYPELLTDLEIHELRAVRRDRSVPRFGLMLLAEVVEAKTGQVLWVGKVAAEVNHGEHALEEATDAIVQRLRAKTSPQVAQTP